MAGAKGLLRMSCTHLSYTTPSIQSDEATTACRQMSERELPGEHSIRTVVAPPVSSLFFCFSSPRLILEVPPPVFTVDSFHSFIFLSAPRLFSLVRDQQARKPPLELAYVEPFWVHAGHGGPLPEYDWGQSSNTTEPAGQDGRAEQETSSAHIFHPPHHHAQENDNSLEDPGSQPANPISCHYCLATFRIPRDLNKHLKKHTRPYKCTEDQCTQAFEFQTGLDQHLKEMHDDNAPRYFCPWKDAGCKSKVAAHGTKRKTNLDRHVKNAHGGQQPPT
ncbi:hypothetical protein F5144DRAFT_657216 [Chaetomium tenue]|uniref:Uncharacterized protein n=1 Tax=Chaetomium tenue TaxID=1854479 RepID=A0ACB7NY21_9PEZI|nr:hypothetical protein F5144DRAFT_657216 [Chaetomium globosum]